MNDTEDRNDNMITKTAIVLVRDFDVWAGATDPEHVIITETVSVTCEANIADLLLQSRAGALAGRMAISCGGACVRREGHPDWLIRCTVDGRDRIAQIDSEAKAAGRST